MPRLLIMEGNTIARQKDAAALGCRSASAVYMESIASHFPTIDMDVINAADRDQALPPGTSFEDYDGLVISGSGLRAFDQTFEVTNQIELLKAFSKTGLPILGSCWGLQIAAIAGGGSVAASPNGREFGFARKLLLNAAGRAHPYFKNKPDVFDSPCIHYDEVDRLPCGSEVLCSNAHSHVQGAIVPVGKSEVWAVQYHPEFDLAQLSMLMELYNTDMVKQGFFANEAECAAYKDKLDRLCANPSDGPSAWQLGIDGDVLDDKMRRAEIINWINHQIIKSS